MAATEDRDTLGRARLSFAKQQDVDEFVDMLDKFERGEITPDEWRVFRLVRGTYGQRQLGDASMLRIKIPQGILDVRQLEARGGRRRALLARVRPHHHAAEHPAALPQAARRRARDAPSRRRRPDHARGVRQLGAQHHRLPVLGRGRRRALRRDAVCRGADALSAAPPAQRHAAAQVQDRLRGLHPRSHRRGHQRHRLDRASAHGRRPAQRGFRVTVGGRHRHADPIGQRAVRVPAGRRDVQRRRGHHPRVPPARRLQAQAAQPPEVPRALARLGRLQGGVRQGARRVPARRRRPAAVRPRAAAGRGGPRRTGGCAGGRRHRAVGDPGEGQRARDRSPCRARPTR